MKTVAEQAEVCAKTMVKRDPETASAIVKAIAAVPEGKGLILSTFTKKFLQEEIMHGAVMKLLRLVGWKEVEGQDGKLRLIQESSAEQQELWGKVCDSLSRAVA